MARATGLVSALVVLAAACSAGRAPPGTPRVPRLVTDLVDDGLRLPPREVMPYWAARDVVRGVALARKVSCVDSDRVLLEDTDHFGDHDWGPREFERISPVPCERIAAGDRLVVRVTMRCNKALNMEPPTPRLVPARDVAAARAHLRLYERLYAIPEHLRERVVVAWIAAPSPQLAVDALDLASPYASPQLQAAVAVALTHPSPDVRWAAIDYARRFVMRSRPTRAVVDALLSIIERDDHELAGLAFAVLDRAADDLDGAPRLAWVPAHRRQLAAELRALFARHGLASV